MSVALVCVVSGESYARYSQQLGESADEFFHPDEDTEFFVLDGREGWPAATLYRYHALLENERFLLGFHYVFLCDADMQFQSHVGAEILGVLVATQHPGFVGRPKHALPYERRRVSRAYVAPDRGGVYYAGGFIGGRRLAFLNFADDVSAAIDCDDADGITAVWHDESHVNAILSDGPPTVVLTPSYCYPDDDSGYALSGYERKLVALDKTPAERGGR